MTPEDIAKQKAEALRKADEKDEKATAAKKKKITSSTKSRKAGVRKKKN